jgi:hypothetical protein
MGIVDDGNCRVEIYITEAKNATLGPWQELNLRPCDFGAALCLNQGPQVQFLPGI